MLMWKHGERKFPILKNTSLSFGDRLPERMKKQFAELKERLK